MLPKYVKGAGEVGVVENKRAELGGWSFAFCFCLQWWLHLMIFFFLISAHDNRKRLQTTTDFLKINPPIPLHLLYELKCLSHSTPICVCNILLPLLARTAGGLTTAFQQWNLPKRKILLCAFKLKLNNILRWHEMIFVCTFIVLQMSALSESPKCLQSSLIPELHEINVFLRSEHPEGSAPRAPPGGYPTLLCWSHGKTLGH